VEESSQLAYGQSLAISDEPLGVWITSSGIFSSSLNPPASSATKGVDVAIPITGDVFNRKRLVPGLPVANAQQLLGADAPVHVFQLSSSEFSFLQLKILGGKAKLTSSWPACGIA
jgi:hypothetical protein